jgi:hypothetical protein
VSHHPPPPGYRELRDPQGNPSGRYERAWDESKELIVSVELLLGLFQEGATLTGVTGVEGGLPADAKVLDVEYRKATNQIVLHMDRPVGTPTLRWRKFDVVGT